MIFFDRADKLEALRKIRERSLAEAQLTVVTGRRLGQDVRMGLVAKQRKTVADGLGRSIQRPNRPLYRPSRICYTASLFTRRHLPDDAAQCVLHWSPAGGGFIQEDRIVRMFPNTPEKLLKDIAELREGDDAAEWQAFVALYAPPLRNFVRTVNERLSPSDVEEVVQDIFVRLVAILRNRVVDLSKARFHTYLAQVVRNLLIDRYRKSLVRAGWEGDGAADGRSMTTLLRKVVGRTPDPGEIFDIRWRMAVQSAAIDHILTKTAISERSKAIYRALLGRTPGLRHATPHQVAAHFGVSYAVVKQVKSRLDRAVAALESRIHARAKA